MTMRKGPGAPGISRPRHQIGESQPEDYGTPHAERRDLERRSNELLRLLWKERVRQEAAPKPG